MADRGSRKHEPLLARLRAAMADVVERLATWLRPWGDRLAGWQDALAPLVDLRIIIVAMLAGTLLLLAVPAGVDVVRGMVDNSNAGKQQGFWQHMWASGLILQWISLWVACLLTGFSAWLWPELLYLNRWAADGGDRHQPGWYRHLRRLLGLLPFAVAAVATLKAANWHVGDVWIALLADAVGVVLMIVLFIRRRTKLGRAQTDIDNMAWWFLVITLVLALGLFLGFMVPGLRTRLAWAMGPAAVAFASIGSMVACTSVIVLVLRRAKLPLVTLSLLAFLLFSLWNDNHDVRTLAPPPPYRPTLDAALLRWDEAATAREAGGAPRPLVIVATAGGASRAAYWTGTVLDTITAPGGPIAGQDIFAISSVSGGSLGAIGWAAWAARPDTAGSNRSEALVQGFFGRDHLSPAVAGMLFPDFVQRFLPVALVPDRAVSLEEGFEMAWAAAAGDNAMASDFDAIWAGRLFTGSELPWVPLVFANGTHVETGKRIITAPVAVSPDVFEDAYDFIVGTGTLRASTAVTNSARFPIVSPAGAITRGCAQGHIVDGGYFENGGLETALDVARRARMLLPRRRVVIVEINNDDEASGGDIARCPGTGDCRLPLASPPPFATGMAGELWYPVATLLATRGAHGVLAGKRLSRNDAGGIDDGIDHVLFALSRDTPEDATAMSWVLSPHSRERMNLAFSASSGTDTGFQRRSRAAVARLQMLVAAAPAPAPAR
jgi:hypothetical protein